jgi:anti-sigma regulatory factor (Ser/Thr protein kinase)
LEACRAAGFDEGRAHDLMTAASESAMNALVHAGGGTVTVGTAKAGTVQVRVEDGGGGIALDSLHRATLEKGFTTAGSMGYGFFMMLQTCDRIHLLTGPGGTTVVLEQDAVADETPYPDRAILLPTV